MPEAARRDEPVDARVVEGMPNALYRVELQDQSRAMVVAHVAGASGILRILPGDLVAVELLAHDHTRGRIVRKR